jgi:hypothetical protein
MKKDVSDKIIKKIQDGPYEENVKKFLLWAIREEFGNRGKSRWIFKESYDSQISYLSREK